MRNPLLALCLCLASTLPLGGQMVEESFSRDPGPLDYIQGDSYEQWILQSLAGDALVGIGTNGRVVPRLAVSWKTRKDGTITFTLHPDARFTDGSFEVPLIPGRNPFTPMAPMPTFTATAGPSPTPTVAASTTPTITPTKAP